jgi:hypothetical protein
MKKLSLYVFAVALTLGIAVSLLSGVAIQSTKNATIVTNRATDAAFHDGLYVGKLDAAQGNRPHLSSGRWSTETNRRSYIAGYQKGYNQVLLSDAAKISGPQIAELAGYRDGLADGGNDRRSAKPFQLSKTDNYRSAARGLVQVQADQEQSRLAYRKAYANGYQEAYYGREHSTADASELSSSL